jgi:hypothetical protein
MRRFRKLFAAGVSCLAIGALPLLTTSTATHAAEEAAASLPVSIRISPTQYQQTIADIFGGAIQITGRFEPEVREEGLAAIGAIRASFSDAGVERYDDLARGISKQVMSDVHRDVLMPCKPKSATAADEACARAFITSTGRLLYRRPLREDETQGLLHVATKGAEDLKDFYTGLSLALNVMLISPEFLFLHRTYEPDPANPGKARLDAFSKATMLSYLLWNSAPDDMLLKAAENGKIHTADGLRREVDRMVSSPAVENGVRAFFYDMLDFAKFEIVSKEPAFFPQFTNRIKDDAQEQTLRTLVDHLVTRQGDYRDVFTTRHTYLNRALASIYGVPLIERTDNGQPMRWQPYTYPENDPRAGLLAQVSFTALHSPAGRTAPTDRGKAVRENILCQRVPAPPGNVDFTQVETADGNLKTARERLTMHSKEPMCAGCHKITDPMGFALENFDSAGAFRTTENGAKIDASGELSGVKFDGPVGLAQTLRNDPGVPACVAKRVFAFGTGRLPATNSDEWKAIEQGFASSKYKFTELLRQVAMSNLFYQVPNTQLASAK